MANVLNGNTFFIDSSSASGTSGSFLTTKDLAVEGFLLGADAATSAITISDLRLTNGTYTAGDTKIILTTGTYTQTATSLANTPIKFPNGIWVNIGAGSPKLTLIIKSRG